MSSLWKPRNPQTRTTSNQNQDVSRQTGKYELLMRHIVRLGDEVEVEQAGDAQITGEKWEAPRQLLDAREQQCSDRRC